MSEKIDDEELTFDNKEKAYKLAEELGKKADKNKIEEMKDKLPSMKKGPVVQIWDKVVDIYEAFMSLENSTTLKVMLLGSLIYLVLPTDIIPDFIPITGLLDDVAVLTFIWNKLKDFTIAKNRRKDKKPIGNIIQEKLRFGYEKAFDIAKDKLEKIIKKKTKKVLLNCILSFFIFLIAILFISFNNEISTTFSAVLILGLFIKTLYRTIKNIPICFRFFKYWIKEKSIDRSIELYLKDSYPFIKSLEDLKNKIKVLDDIPSVNTFVKMQRKALTKTIVEISITIILVFISLFLLRRYLLAQTTYSFFDLVLLPLKRLYFIFQN